MDPNKMFGPFTLRTCTIDISVKANKPLATEIAQRAYLRMVQALVGKSPEKASDRSGNLEDGNLISLLCTSSNSG